MVTPDTHHSSPPQPVAGLGASSDSRPRSRRFLGSGSMVLETGASALASSWIPALPCLPAASIGVVADMVSLGWGRQAGLGLGGAV